MPSSFIDSVPPIVKLLVERNPRKVIDVGAGWGKYGLLCREYLPRLEKLWAVEVLEGRLPTQDTIYDRVLVGDVRRYLEPIWTRPTGQKWPWCDFDLVLLIDVIEHLPLDDGHAVLSMMQRAGCPVLVSTPQIFTPQTSVGNPHETHRSLWAWEDFQPHGIEADVSTIDSIIYLLEAR